MTQIVTGIDSFRGTSHVVMVKTAETAVVLPSLALVVIVSADGAAAAVITVHSNEDRAQDCHDLAGHGMPQREPHDQQQNTHGNQNVPQAAVPSSRGP